jgi:hypothetical protein
VYPETEIRGAGEHIKLALNFCSQITSGYGRVLSACNLRVAHTTHYKHWCPKEYSRWFRSPSPSSVLLKDVPSAEVSSSTSLLFARCPNCPPARGNGRDMSSQCWRKLGFLGQVSWCLIVSPRPYDTDFSSGCLGQLQVCSKLIRKKLRSGTPHDIRTL